MNAKIRRMMQEIEQRGGKLHINPSLPDDLTEEFLEQVLSCPDCCTRPETAFDGPPIDTILGRIAVPDRNAGH